ncbi:helix-turn-helix domain-containing protein, partial [bacterium]|nr:helix-turn-helix domain-containing protein [bacterium]MBU1025213.1 helix-turn-helix domain-containing protein [bacterium]
MIIPDNIIEPAISLKDQYFDLKGLEAYSALKVPTLRDYIKSGDLPCFKVKGKILIKRSEF